MRSGFHRESVVVFLGPREFAFQSAAKLQESRNFAVGRPLKGKIFSTRKRVDTNLFLKTVGQSIISYFYRSQLLLSETVSLPSVALTYSVK